MISTTEDTSNITRSFYSVALIFQEVTCAFDAHGLEVAIIFVMSLTLIVCTLSSIPFVFGRLEFYFALFYKVFQKEHCNFETLYKLIQMTCVVFLKGQNVPKLTEFYLG
jgi:hypothetical protein